MAFTATQLLSISRIVGVTPTFLNAHIASLGVTLTAAVETAVIAELARWDASGAAFVKLHPTESNFGVETNSGDAKSDIIRNIAILLELFDYMAGPRSMGTMQIGR